MHGERRRWVGAEWSGVWEGVSQLIRGMWERRELPTGVRGTAPAEKRILAYFEGHRTSPFCTYMTKSEGGNLD